MATVKGSEIQAALLKLNKAANARRKSATLFSVSNDLQGGYSLLVMMKSRPQIQTVAKGTKRDIISAIECLTMFLELTDIEIA